MPTGIEWRDFIKTKIVKLTKRSLTIVYLKRISLKQLQCYGDYSVDLPDKSRISKLRRGSRFAASPPGSGAGFKQAALRYVP